MPIMKREGKGEKGSPRSCFRLTRGKGETSPFLVGARKGEKGTRDRNRPGGKGRGRRGPSCSLSPTKKDNKGGERKGVCVERGGEKEEGKGENLLELTASTWGRRAQKKKENSHPLGSDRKGGEEESRRRLPLSVVEREKKDQGFVVVHREGR